MCPGSRGVGVAAAWRRRSILRVRPRAVEEIRRLVQCVVRVAQLIDHRREALHRRGDEDLEVDGPVAVHDPVPQPGRLLPGDLGVVGLQVVGQLRGGLAEDGEVPQEGVAALAVCGESLGRLVDGEEMGLLGGVDHLLEQEELTPHTGSVPRTGPHP